MSKIDKLPCRYAQSDAVLCVVESPKGSPTKFKYDPELKLFVFGRPLPVGLTYPFDWGFIPSTLADDGDPLDVMILHDVPAFVGCVVPCTLIGALEVKELEDGESQRNDRLFAVPLKSHRENELREIDDLGQRMRDELKAFFIAAAALEDKTLEILRWVPKRDAFGILDRAAKRFSH